MSHDTTTEIDKNILPAFIDFNVTPLSSSEPSITRRYTEAELKSNFVKNLRQHQESYIEQCQKEQQFFEENLKFAKDMDATLGTTGERKAEVKDVGGGLEKLKDGTVKLDCPMICGVSSFKLRRHLVHVHKNLTVDQIEYCLQVSRRMAKNKGLQRRRRNNDVVCNRSSSSRSSSSSSKYKNTHLVNRKSNYKRCVLCEKLFVNIYDHLRNIHKLKREDPRYTDYISKCEVIPKVLTKIANGSVQELKGEELQEAQEKYGR